MTVNDDERDAAYVRLVESVNEKVGSLWPRDVFRYGWDAHASLAVPAGKGEEVSPYAVRVELERLNEQSADIMDMSRGLIAFFALFTPSEPSAETERDGRDAKYFKSGWDAAKEDSAVMAGGRLVEYTPEPSVGPGGITPGPSTEDGR